MKIGCLLLLAVFIIGCVQTQQEKMINVVARQFEFEPREILVDKGEVVTIKLTSEDVPHGLGIAEYNVNIVTGPGGVVEATFRADRTGNFTIYCTVFCGTGHPTHKGVLVVR